MKHGKSGIERLSQNDNVYMKVSAVMEQSTQQPAPTEDGFYAPALEAMWQVFGAKRLIYGSNWPVCERAGSFADAFAIVRRFLTAKERTRLSDILVKCARCLPVGLIAQVLSTVLRSG